MHYLTETLVADRIHRIEQEAATERLARLTATEQTRAWRRHLGNGARRLSSTLDGFAAQLDPSCRPSYGRE